MVRDSSVMLDDIICSSRFLNNVILKQQLFLFILTFNITYIFPDRDRRRHIKAGQSSRHLSFLFSILEKFLQDINAFHWFTNIPNAQLLNLSLVVRIPYEILYTVY